MNFKESISFWISWRICSVVCPGKIIHSNSTGSASMPSYCLYWCVPLNHASQLSHSIRVFVYLPDTQYSMSLIDSSSFARASFFHRPCPAQFCHSRYLEFLFVNQFFESLRTNSVHWVSVLYFCDGVQITEVVIPKKDCCVH